MQGVTNAILNTIFVSLPEETFYTLMTLIFLKRYDLLDFRMWKENIAKLMIPIVPVSILINIFRYIVIIDKIQMMIITIIIFYILLLYIVIKYKVEDIERIHMKVLLNLAYSVAIWVFLEEITLPSLLFLMNYPLEFISNNIFWNFVLGIPSRIIAITIIIYNIVKNSNEISDIKVLSVITNNKLYRRIVLFCTMSFILVSLFLIKLIWINKIFDNKVPLFEKIVITESLFILPVVVIFLIIILINNLLVKEKQIQQNYENLVIQDDISLDVEDR